jgi:dienelactone hydrolase
VRLGLALLAAALLATPSSSAAPGLFDYTRSVPLDLVVRRRFERSGIEVRVIEFSVDRKLRTRAYLALPRGDARHPAILFVPGRRMTKDFFLGEAVADARRGAVGMSLDDLSEGYPTFTDGDRAKLVRRVVAVRRALDVLTAHPSVDTRRIAVVGHSDGAELAGILAGADRRAMSYVLMCGGGVWDRTGAAAYDSLVAPADAARYIGRAAPAALFFQSALADQFVPRADALRYQQVASQPKRGIWYAADHALNAQAMRDRQAWLKARGVLSW